MTRSSSRVFSASMWSLWLGLALLFVLPGGGVDAAASDTAMSLLSSAKDIRVGPAIVAIIAMAVGVVMAVAGYRLFRVAIFVSGFILGGIGVASFIEWVFKHKSWMVTASWIGFAVGGLVVGLLAMTLWRLSIFVAGAAGGVLLAFTIHTTVAYRIYPNNPNVVLAILAIALGLLFGILAVKIQRPVLIVATSFVGAVMLAWGIGYFAGDFPTASDLKYYGVLKNGTWVYKIPHAWWGYLVGIIVVFVLGMMIQFRKTGREEHHFRALGKDPETRTYGNLDTPPAYDRHPGSIHYGNPVSHV